MGYTYKFGIPYNILTHLYSMSCASQAKVIYPNIYYFLVTKATSSLSSNILAVKTTNSNTFNVLGPAQRDFYIFAETGLGHYCCDPLVTREMVTKRIWQLI